MRRRSSFILGGVVFVVLGVLFYREMVPGPTGRVVTRQSAPAAPTSGPSRVTPDASAAVPGAKATDGDGLQLLDPAVDAKLRVRAIRELPLEATLSASSRKLVELVVSPNPVSRDPDPHSTSAYQHQREAALRVYALRRLSEELSVENFSEVVERVERESTDAALVRIAQEALKAKKRGGNYFHELTQGIRSAPMPD